MAGSMAYRLPVQGAAKPHMKTFIDAMSQSEAITDNRGYNHVAGFHGAPGWYCWHHQINPRTSVQSRLFLPWHRAYLWWLEQSLQDFVDGVALPWWDWTSSRGIPTAYSSRSPSPNPLRSTKAYVPTATPPINRRTRRAPGRAPKSRLPDALEVSDLLKDSDWASFSDRLEDFHDHVHVWVGGDMLDVTTAAYDPIFFAHHCMIDRIWYLWQVRYGNGGIPHELLDLPLLPFGKKFRDVLDVQALGYEYASSTAAVPVEGGHHG